MAAITGAVGRRRLMIDEKKLINNLTIRREKLRYISIVALHNNMNYVDTMFNSVGNKENMKVRIKTRVYIPEYKSDGAAGMDIRALLPSGSCIIFPGQIEIIPTGISLELPKGYEAQVRARSGLSTKHGIGIVSGVGTIDSDYRGEIGVPLINWGTEPFTVNDGDRIAQLVVARCEKVEFVVVDELTETERGTGGFGSTGR